MKYRSPVWRRKADKKHKLAELYGVMSVRRRSWNGMLKSKYRAPVKRRAGGVMQVLNSTATLAGRGSERLPEAAHRLIIMEYRSISNNKTSEHFSGVTAALMAMRDRRAYGLVVVRPIETRRPASLGQASRLLTWPLLRNQCILSAWELVCGR